LSSFSFFFLSEGGNDFFWRNETETGQQADSIRVKVSMKPTFVQELLAQSLALAEMKMATQIFQPKKQEEEASGEPKHVKIKEHEQGAMCHG